ncbi:MAG: hypothetical protein KHZ95_08985 [Eubacterium sp.]|nr:hypothetical protein [Eubacterium sp.]
MKKKKLLFTVVISTVLSCSCSSNTNENTTSTTTEVTTITTEDVKQESISNSVALSDFLTRLNKNLKNSKLYQNVDFVQHEAEYRGKSEDGGDTYNINIMDNLIVSCIVKNNDITSMMVVAKPVDSTSNVFTKIVMQYSIMALDPNFKDTDITSMMTDFSFDTAAGGSSSKIVNNYKYTYGNANEKGSFLVVEKTF